MAMRTGRQWRHWFPRFNFGWSPAFLLAAFTAILPAAGQQPERRLLVLYPDSDIPAVSNVSEGIRKKLAGRSSLKVQTFREFLDLSRFPNEAHRQRVVRYLSEKYADTNLDAIVALGPDSLRIAVENRPQLAPGVPIVFCCTSPNTLSAIERPPDVTGVVSEFDVTRTVEIARRLQPAARHLVVVAGAAPFDLRWVEIARRQARIAARPGDPLPRRVIARGSFQPRRQAVPRYHPDRAHHFPRRRRRKLRTRGYRRASSDGIECAGLRPLRAACRQGFCRDLFGQL